MISLIFDGPQVSYWLPPIVRKGPMTHPRATIRHGRLLMSIIHAATANTDDRPSNKLNIRQRLVIQRLGLDGPASLSTLGQALGIVPSSTTVVADRLEALGLVERTAKIGDRRATVLKLTAEGERTFEAEVDFYRSLVDETLGAMGDEAAHDVLATLAALEPTDHSFNVA